MKTRNTFWLWPLLAPHRRTLLMGLGATLLCGAATAWVPYWSGRAVHALELGKWHQSRQMLGLMIACTVVAGLGRYWMRNTLIGLSRTLERIQREDLFNFLLSRPKAFYDAHALGDLMTRCGDDIAAVRMATGPGLMSLLQTFSVMPVTVALMIHTQARLTLWVMSPFLLLGAGFYAIGQFSHRNQQKLQKVTAQLSTFSHETISGEKVVQAFCLEEIRTDTFRELSQEQARLNVWQVFFMGLYGPLAMLMGGLAALALIGVGSRMVLQNRLSLGDLTAFIGYLAALSWPVISLGWSFNLLQRAKAGQERIDQILQDPTPSLPLPETFEPPHPSAPVHLQLKDVVFRFEKGRGLGPISLEIQPGSRVAIVGHIGSGKSILLQLLAGLRFPQEGSIFVNGEPLTLEGIRSHWKHLGWVGQEAFLFSTSLKENLTLGHPDASDEDIGVVLHAVALDSFVKSLGAGLETVVGERGVILSGGERQRCALARALLRKPSLLLLDDALSAVDAQTEQHILNQLPGSTRNATLIMSTHRVSTAMQCDHVLLLQDGRIVESGSPQTLLHQEGPFARLHTLQVLEASMEQGS